jgi:hypothetical protein
MSDRFLTRQMLLLTRFVAGAVVDDGCGENAGAAPLKSGSSSKVKRN